MKRTSLILIVALTLMLSACGGDSAAVLPSDAYNQFNETLQGRMNEITTREQFNQVRKEIAEDLLANVKTEDLEPMQAYFHGVLLNHAQKTEEANEILASVAAENSLAGRMASAEMISTLVQAEDYPALHEAVVAHQQQFPSADPEFVNGIARPLSALMYNYIENNENEKAIELIEAELARLDYAAPYDSFRLIGYARDSYEALDKLEEYKATLSDVSQKLNAKIEEVRTEGEAGQAQQLQAWQSIAKALDGALRHIELLGQTAPAIEFTEHFYNSEPFTLAGLKGKVVMVDFWANWCGPCKSAFPKMRELYEEYKDDGFEIVGVTSFQGRFRDGDINEGSIDESRELELTEQFIADHEMTWPIVFSSESVFNPDYGVQGIPTFAVLDKEGNVRLIQVGSGEASEKKLRETVTELLAE